MNPKTIPETAALQQSSVICRDLDLLSPAGGFATRAFFDRLVAFVRLPCNAFLPQSNCRMCVYIKLDMQSLCCSR